MKLLQEIKLAGEYLLQLDSQKENSHLKDMERATTKQNIKNLTVRIQRILDSGVTRVAGAKTTREVDINID